jgi:hypothetical protein
MYNATRELIVNFLKNITNTGVESCLDNWGVGKQIWLTGLKSPNLKIIHLWL